MKRTVPIAWFERCYLAAFAVRLAVSLANWQRVEAGGVQVSIIVGLLLWYGIVYRRSVIAAVVACLYFAGSLVLTLVSFASAVDAGGVILIYAGILLLALLLNATSLFALAHAAREGWFRKAG